MQWILEDLFNVTGFTPECTERYEHGATIFEYAILVAILAIAAIAIIAVIGGETATPFQTAIDAFSAGDKKE